MTEEGRPVTDFFEAVFRYTFLQYALLTGILAAIACGVTGSYVVTRRITYIGGGIAHSVLGGMGAAYFLSAVYGWGNIKPIYGAIVAALVAAIIIGLVSLRARQREDTVISAIYALGMALGIIFISKTPGYNQDLMSYLFGNILMVSQSDLWLIGGLDIIVVGAGLLFYNQLLIVCFDEEFARTRGINVEFYYLLLLCLTALTVVILVTVVGIVMVIALLTLPAAIAGFFAKSLRQTMLLATLISIVLTVLGLAVSFTADLPTGATIILIAGIIYIISAGVKTFISNR
jgi:zinc transport system permease protein